MKNQSSVWSNTASQSGGGIYLTTSWLIYPDNLIIDNSAVGNNKALKSGGGIEAQRNSYIVISGGSRITQNTALESGGGIHFVGNYGAAKLKITDTYIGGNRASGGGGGIATNGNVDFTIYNVLMSFNKAGDLGGAISAGGGLHRKALLRTAPFDITI